MTDPESKVALNMLLDAIDAPYALVILVDENNEIESGDKNLGLENTMIVCFSLAYEIAQKLKADMPQEPRVPTHRNNKPVIYLPPDLQRKLDAL